MGDAIDTGTTSIHVSKNDKKVAEKYDMEQIGPGSFYHEAVREMDTHRELKQEKAEELAQRMDQLLSEADKWGIEASGRVKQPEW